MNIEGLNITWKGHDCFAIESAVGMIYTDPFQLAPGSSSADYIFITHEHFDHCNIEDIQKIVTPSTIIVATPDCQSKLSKLTFKQLVIVEPNKSYTAGALSLRTIPAYNTNKFRSPGVAFHPKNDGKVGYIITINAKHIYLAGDTDHIPEMDALHGIDIALVPVSGTYVMTAQEAAAAVNTFNPRTAIPMHYGSIVGDDADAQEFKKLAHVPVHILEKE